MLRRREFSVGKDFEGDSLFEGLISAWRDWKITGNLDKESQSQLTYPGFELDDPLKVFYNELAGM
jgi:hypothetical protein